MRLSLLYQQAFSLDRPTLSLNTTRGRVTLAPVNVVLTTQPALRGAGAGASSTCLTIGSARRTFLLRYGNVPLRVLVMCLAALHVIPSFSAISCSVQPSRHRAAAAAIQTFRFGKKDKEGKWEIKPAAEPLVRALMLAIWTGQRQGDLLKLTWKAYDGHSIYLRQSKTGAHVRMKVSEELKSYLDGVPRGNSVTILTNGQGQPWATGFKSSWRKAVEKAGIEGKTFHDLRGTFVTLAYRNGASIKEIAEVSGHSEKDAEGIIRKHYLVSSAAVESIENRQKRFTGEPG